eukprot:gene13931-biopygen6553
MVIKSPHGDERGERPAGQMDCWTADQTVGRAGRSSARAERPAERAARPAGRPSTRSGGPGERSSRRDGWNERTGGLTERPDGRTDGAARRMGRTAERAWTTRPGGRVDGRVLRAAATRSGTVFSGVFGTTGTETFAAPENANINAIALIKQCRKTLWSHRLGYDDERICFPNTLSQVPPQRRQRSPTPSRCLWLPVARGHKDLWTHPKMSEMWIFCVIPSAARLGHASGASVVRRRRQWTFWLELRGRGMAREAVPPCPTARRRRSTPHSSAAARARPPWARSPGRSAQRRPAVLFGLVYNGV